MKLDPIDIIILKELNNDGRASFREIAKRASLSTPTVSTRFERMMHSGLIQKFVPIFNSEASENPGILALITLNAPASKTKHIAQEFQRMQEVYGVCITTGQNNLLLRVSLQNAQDLQRFLDRPIFKMKDVTVVANQIIIENIKDNHPLPFSGAFQIRLRCDLCKQEITSSKPYTLKVGPTRYYFCCKTCRKTYMGDHASRINKLNKLARAEEGQVNQR
ncbi:MAG: AsnC family transcriptional regulator [Nitrososphaerota archaeon]|nr:AsnC family transcriptional regulator [Nitrososphaerota archaeon]MDG6922431.1 AsnC family transcriptional regulator [Nitrososphaerota archaeon]